MINWRELTTNEQIAALQNVAGAKHIPPQAVEKDLWVTTILQIVFSLSFADSLVFKGGTSLSKVFGKIERFSEDIDLAIDRTYFGLEGDLTKKQLKKLRKQSSTFVRDTFLGELQEAFRQHGLTELSAAAGNQSSFWGPIGVEYYYHVSPVVGLGAVAAYAGCKAEDEKTHKDDLSETFITIMPSVKFNWLRKKHFGMYSGLSAGIMFISVSPNDNAKANDSNAKDETLVSFMFQATALGAEFGGEQFRGFVEAGFGEKGVLCAGLRYKF